MARLGTKRSPVPRKWDHRSTEVRSNASGGAVIAVISDTHGNAHPDSVRLVAETKPDAVLHGGDIGNPEVLAPFADIAPLIVVRGNIDARRQEAKAATDTEIDAGASTSKVDFPDSVDVKVFDRSGQPLSTILLQHICLAGVKLRGDAAKNAEAHRANIVVCGHSHIPFIGRDRGRIVFNPGSIGPRRFALPIVFGLMTFCDGKLKLQHVSCETGQPWYPEAPPT